MQITRMARPKKEMANVKLWSCEGCGVVHMSVGKVLLNFSREEFADFAGAVNDVAVTSKLGAGKAYSIIDLIASEDDHGSHDARFVH